jgi:putative flippase GtrA
MSHTPIEPRNNNRQCYRVLAEIFLVLRFGLVGSIATGIHILILWVLLSKILLPVFIANAIAFVSAFGFSFAGNYLWTFGAPGSPRRAMLRFLIISTSAFFLNNALLALILGFGWLDSTQAAIGSAAVIPVITFLTSRFWGFKHLTPTLASANKPE